MITSNKILKKLESELIDGMMLVFGLQRVRGVLFPQDAAVVDLRSQTYMRVLCHTKPSTEDD